MCICICIYVYAWSYLYAGTDPREIGFSLCNVDMQIDDVAKVCINEDNGQCIVDIITTPPSSFVCDDYAVTLIMIDARLEGWEDAQYTITDPSNANSIIASGGHVNNGFIDSEHICIPNGCYDFNMYGPIPISKSQSYQTWIACGVRGVI